jgi:hypothetical protein
MSKFTAILITAAVCLPLGALLSREATADRRRNDRYGAVIAEHPRLSRAQAALHDALDELQASQRANEMLWSDPTGRAAETKAAVEKAVQMLDGTANWLRNGMARNSAARTGVELDQSSVIRPY